MGSYPLTSVPFSPRLSTSTAVLILLLFSLGETTPFPRCTDPAEDFVGYTFSVDQGGGERVWSHCAFPNPLYDHSRCGLPPSQPLQYFICDPDNIVTNEVAVDVVLKTVQSNASTVCLDAEGEGQSYIVTVALVDHIRLPDLSSPNRCENDCGELRPLLNTTVRSPTTEEVRAAMAAFAHGLRRHWGLGACENDVVVLYCRQHNAIYTSLGSRAAATLTPLWVSSMESTLLGYASRGQLGEGLLLIANDFRISLRGLAPALVILLLMLIGLVLVVLFVVFYLHLNDRDLNVWGYEKQWKVLESIFMLITGAWLIHGLFLAIARVANAVPLWLAIVFSACSAACFTVFLMHDFVFPQYGVYQRYNLTT